MQHGSFDLVTADLYGRLAENPQIIPYPVQHLAVAADGGG